MVVKPSHFGSSKEQTPSSPLQLSSLAGYQKFGEYLRTKRKQFGLTQNEMGERFTTLTGQTYGYLERERRAPQVDELVPMFAVLVELQSDKRLPPIQAIEAETFFRLGKALIEKKQRKRQNVLKQQWNEIEQALINLADSHQRNVLHLVTDASTNILVLESPDSRRRKALEDTLKEDTSHLLERDEWVNKVSAYPDKAPQIKVGIIQGSMGAGKSHALALLIQRLAQREDLFLVPYRFLHSETMTADDHLDKFLATIYSDLTMKATDETKQHPLAERISRVLNAIRAFDQKVVLLLDDAQEMFPSAGEWSTFWHQFFETFISEPHTATMYVFTRTWPRWDERKRSFLEEDDLPDLSLASGILLWKRQGFDDVDDELLRKVCQRCGQNPQTIEMLAFQARRRGFSMTWGYRNSSNSTDNPHTASLKKLLAGETLFSGNLDEKSRRALLQVFSNRLSGETMRLVECLALSPLGVPFDIMFEQFENGDESFEDLVKASFADLSMAAAGRASVVPLVREATLQSLTKQRKEEVEQLVTEFYAYWLSNLQDFRDDAEKAALIAEMVVRYLRARQPLEAAELFLSFGWLGALFGHMARIQRVFEEYVEGNRGKAEDAEHEIGKLLLQHRVAIVNGQKIVRAERDQMYQNIHNKIFSGELHLEPHSWMAVMHNMRLLYTRNAQYAEAKQMFDSAYDHLRHSGQTNPEVFASLLFDEAQLFFSWSESYEQHTPEALHYTQAATNTLKECITQWHLCLKNALPLQEHYTKFQLARALNDYAYALRALGLLPEAQEAIEGSIQLKRENASLAYSLAISLSEQSQILLLQGKIRQSLGPNEEAIPLLERAIERGDTAHAPELGMLLSERANIFWQQARLIEAQPLLERAVALIGDKPSRQHYKQRALAQLEEIQQITNSGRPYQLDRQWFLRYEEFVTYDDLYMLTQAGPFTEDEQVEFTRLSFQSDDEARDRMLELASQSRMREFTRSLEEQCAPIIYYPFIPVEDLRERARGLTDLWKNIESNEQNAVVRRLYCNAIDEHLTILRLLESIALRDQDTVWECHQELYGKPSQHEMKIALQVLCTTLLDARNHNQAGPVAQEALAQLKKWGISARVLVAEELYVPKQATAQPIDHKILVSEKMQFPTTAVRQFFSDVLRAYGAENWEVSISVARDHTYVDPNVKKLVLPQKSFSVSKIRQLLAEEIETHTFRSLAGQHTPLALLGLGLARQEATEEGLAKWYIQRVNQSVSGESQENTWIGTLATGLASGVLTPTLSFQELRNFLTKTYLVQRFIEEGESQEDALAAARRLAWTRACRTFRGVPNLTLPGCCSLKDVIYLRGHLEISRYFECDGDEQQLYVGAVGIDHLEDLAELNIVAPCFPHRHFALIPDLADRLSKYKD